MVVVPKSICLGKDPIRLRSVELWRDKTEQNRERYQKDRHIAVFLMPIDFFGSSVIEY